MKSKLGKWKLRLGAGVVFIVASFQSQLLFAVSPSFASDAATAESCLTPDPGTEIACPPSCEAARLGAH